MPVSFLPFSFLSSPSSPPPPLPARRQESHLGAGAAPARSASLAGDLGKGSGSGRRVGWSSLRMEMGLGDPLPPIPAQGWAHDGERGARGEDSAPWFSLSPHPQGSMAKTERRPPTPWTLSPETLSFVPEHPLRWSTPSADPDCGLHQPQPSPGLRFLIWKRLALLSGIEASAQ